MAEAADATANRSWRGWLKFIAIGLSGYVVLTLGVIALVELAGRGERLSYAVMIMTVMLGNFYANRRFVYPHSNRSKASHQAARFFAIAMIFRVIEFYSFSLLIGPLEMNYVIALTLTSALGYLIKYFVFSIWVFR